MKNNRGYTVVELIIVIAVVGVISFVAINKASYAFSDNIETQIELTEQKKELIEMQAAKYGEEHKELFEESDTIYISVSDLIDNNYIINSSVDKTKKIKLTFRDDKIRAKLEN